MNEGSKVMNEGRSHGDADIGVDLVDLGDAKELTRGMANQSDTESHPTLKTRQAT